MANSRSVLAAFLILALVSACGPSGQSTIHAGDINGIVSGELVGAGETKLVDVEASGSDSLTFIWEDSSGVVQSGRSSQLAYVVPSTPGEALLKVTVRSDAGGEIIKSVHYIIIVSTPIQPGEPLQNPTVPPLAPADSATPTASPTPTPTPTPTLTLSNAVLTLNEFYSSINNATTPDELVRSWNLETSGPDGGFQCREPSACKFSYFRDWWWNWIVKYKLYDCGGNAADVEEWLYYRNKPTSGSSTNPTYLRQEVVADQGQWKIDRGSVLKAPEFACSLVITSP